MEGVGIFYVNLVYLQPLNVFYGHWDIFPGSLVYFFSFWCVVARKIWQPWPKALS
jgi:hypothetical protein